MVPRPPYSGLSRRLVLAFDVGTTFSGVSYSILDPGVVPEVKQVMRFPYHDATTGNCKVPSIIWYDADGEVRAIGAGAVVDGIEQEAKDRWTKVEWFKLHMRPKTLDADEISIFHHQIHPLPAGKTVVDVFADYYKFLYESTTSYIQSTYSTGKLIWESVRPNAVFVFSHPNGWEGPQQSQMREAAILAGLVADTDEGRNQILFVTEGEASLHFCLNQGLMTERIKTDSRILVVDAGGGTIDISSYQKQEDDRGSFSELAASECKLRGSIFVTKRARIYLEGYLRNSSFVEDVPEIVKRFDKAGKLSFRRKQDPVIIPFGRLRDNDLAYGIRHGHLTLPGDVVASFFQSSIECIVGTIRKHCQAYGIKIVFLVGGFAANDWLFSTLQTAVHTMGIEISRPEDQPSKAVAIGVASFYIDHFVSTRVSKFDYGTDYSRPYDAQKADHIARQAHKFITLDGEECLKNAFDIILPRNSRVNEKKEFKNSFSNLSTTIDSLRSVTTEVFHYRGTLERPEWMDEDADNFGVMCTIEADTCVASAALVPRRGKDRQTYFKLDFEIVLLFGLTEFKAQISWKENGIEKRGPARVVYEPIIDMLSRQPHLRTSRRLVLAFDVGMSFSGVSYSIIEPGSMPEIRQVKRYPSLKLEGLKVPSIIWYDANGRVCAIGAGAVRDGVEEEAEAGQWTKVKWFKLLLWPTSSGAEGSQFPRHLPPLPAGKTIVDVFADYYRFLYESSRAYIEDAYPTGRSIWASFQADITFVLSHPNGELEGPQQSQIQQAAVLAGLIPGTDEGRNRIHFVTEGEASLHFCVRQGLMTEIVESESRFLVVEAGSGTIDISSYEKREDEDGGFSKLAAPECRLHGSIFVTQYARKYIEEHLRDSPFLFAAPDITRCFDKTTMRRFRQKEPAFIRFGSSRDNDLAHNIKRGQLKIHGDIVATFFQPSVDCIVDTIRKHFRSHNIRAVFLVGSFAANDWLFNNVQAAVLGMNIEVSRPHARADMGSGAVAYYIDRFVPKD